MKRVLVVAVAVCTLFLLTAAVALADPPSPDATYVGASVCKACHAEKYDAVFQTRHPWKVRPVDDPGVEIIADWTKGEDVRTTVMDDGQTRPFTLDDVDYVIGAKPGWKQRYIKVIDGAWRILPAQFNLATQEWVPYHADEWMERDYRDKCAGCHTTGYDPDTKTWVDFGVTCEACHGPGSEHVAAGGGEDVAIVATVDAQVCARCHVRGKDVNGYGWPQDYRPGGDVKVEDVYTFVTVEDGKIWPDGHAKSHHQQYMEWVNSGHAKALDTLKANPHAQDFCAACHSADARLQGATLETAQFGVTCVTCHDGHTGQESMLRVEAYDTCVECHNGGIEEGAQAEAGSTVHHPMREMFEGWGAVGVTASPSPHFSASDGPICSSCHMVGTAKSAIPGDIASHDWRPIKPADASEGEGDSCTGCHEGAGDAMSGVWDSRQAEISGMLEELKAQLDATKDTAGETEAWKVAWTNYTFVDADGSQGMHNYPYAKAILEAAMSTLETGEVTPAELPTTGGVLPGVMPLVVSGVSLLALGAGAAYVGRRKR